MDDGGLRPAQQRRDDKPDTLAGSCRREAHDMLRPVVTQITVLEPAKEDAGGVEKTEPVDFALGRPAGRSVGSDQPVLPRPPERTGNRDQDAEDTARRRHRAGPIED